MIQRLISCASAVVLALFSLPSLAAEADLRVLVRNSFSLPEPRLAQFEARAGSKLSLIKAGDTGEILNEIILTRVVLK